MPPTLLTILTLAVPSQHASNAAYHPYAHSSLPTCLQHHLPSLRSPSALPTCLQHCLPSLRLQCPPNMPPTLLTILTLAVPSRHASNSAYHPYAYSALPMLLTILTLAECPPDMPPMLLTILTL
ncbi:hypothetical protein O181_033830 [Austropuccinia psidii MF-1]|uniref:Secreted protein n=1 Tax=Austropuccinia psidii MF-1 TaxID=1389203 RepID=A0A9Q3D1Y2_9BASI|nr:hypothetical protein [Austropuccinia psidii MF-1]